MFIKLEDYFGNQITINTQYICSLRLAEREGEKWHVVIALVNADEVYFLYAQKTKEAALKQMDEIINAANGYDPRISMGSFEKEDEL